MKGWYQRWENNGWRPISQRIFVDPEHANVAQQPQLFLHHIPAIRRQQKEAVAKQRRRLWMSKVYRQVAHLLCFVCGFWICVVA